MKRSRSPERPKVSKQSHYVLACDSGDDTEVLTEEVPSILGHVDENKVEKSQVDLPEDDQKQEIEQTLDEFDRLLTCVNRLLTCDPVTDTNAIVTLLWIFHVLATDIEGEGKGTWVDISKDARRNKFIASLSVFRQHLFEESPHIEQILQGDQCLYEKMQRTFVLFEKIPFERAILLRKCSEQEFRDVSSI